MKKLFTLLIIATRLLSFKLLIFICFLGFSCGNFLPAGERYPEQTNFEKQTTLKFVIRDFSSDQSMAKVSGNEPFAATGSFLSYDKEMFYINGEPVFLHSGEMHYFRTPEDQ